MILNKKQFFFKKIVALIFLLVGSFHAYSQVSVNQILNSYDSYTLASREVAYIHLNKSTFIKNEMIGFSAYVFDKDKRILSSKTKNLYCTISDKDNNIVKSKLIKVENGLSNNIFQVDSLFTSGVYTFRAYTNWMLNFNERNYYEHPFLVIDPDTQKVVKKTIVKKKYSIRVLPEGGHLIAKVKNNLGIIVKDEKGFGLANAKGKIIDNNNETITEFTLNKFGITKVKLTPKASKQYKVIVSHNNKNITSNITKIDSKGINLSLVRFENEIAVSFKTNRQTANLIKDKKYELFVHNGHSIKNYSFSFNGGNMTAIFIKNKDLFSGINIFTVFDLEKNVPILERLFFNFERINISSIRNILPKKLSDSITIELSLDKPVDLNKIQNLSISLLPTETKSYNINSNIFSKIFLEGYVKGFIEDPRYYFSNQNEKVKEDLDNLLITQGWSSYSWNNIFENTLYSYQFENGININARINRNSGVGFLIHPMINTNSKIVSPRKFQKEFNHNYLFPIENETYNVSMMNENGKTQKASLYVKFSPSRIPDFALDMYKIPYKNTMQVENFNTEDFKINSSSSNSISQVQLLDEVVVKSEDKEATRIERLKNSKPFSKIEFLDDRITRNKSLAAYISSKGLEARVLSDGRIFINDPRPINVSTTNYPIVMVDGVKLLINCNSENTVCVYPFFLANMSLEIIESIEINRSGVGVGNGRSLITIKTNPAKRVSQRNLDQTYNGISKYKFPLSFDTPKKFYTPIYKNYTSKFFKEYGTIHWFPRLKVDENGKISFKFLNTFSKNINLYIEGVVNDGTFVSETKTVNLQ